MNNVLLKDGEKYGGQYVATKSFKDRKVVSHGSDPSKVFNEAKEKGVKGAGCILRPQKGYGANILMPLKNSFLSKFVLNIDYPSKVFSVSSPPKAAKKKARGMKV